MGQGCQSAKVDSESENLCNPMALPTDDAAERSEEASTADRARCASSRVKSDEGADEAQGPRNQRRECRLLTSQAAGHGKIMRMASSSEGNKQWCWVLKLYDKVEAECYERLCDSEDDPLLNFVAQYFGKVKMREGMPGDIFIQSWLSRNGAAEEDPDYIQLSNLLCSYSRPLVVDMKLGVRSFAESECSKAKPRPDLFERMRKLDPDEPTEEERAAGAITKHRWMAWRDRQSSTGTLGFRIDGVVGPGGLRLAPLEFAALHQREEIINGLIDILPPPRFRSAEDWHALRRQGLEGTQALSIDELELKLALALRIRERLTGLREACEASSFVERHEFVGSSVLLAMQADPPKAEVFLIDFAKTTELPSEVVVDHRSPWKLGNHEDGLLFGIDNCIDCWTVVVAKLRGFIDATKRAS